MKPLLKKFAIDLAAITAIYLFIRIIIEYPGNPGPFNLWQAVSEQFLRALFFGTMMAIIRLAMAWSKRPKAEE